MDLTPSEILFLGEIPTKGALELDVVNNQETIYKAAIQHSSLSGSVKSKRQRRELFNRAWSWEKFKLTPQIQEISIYSSS